MFHEDFKGISSFQIAYAVWNMYDPQIFANSTNNRIEWIGCLQILKVDDKIIAQLARI